MRTTIKSTCDILTQKFDTIEESRKVILRKIADYVKGKISKDEVIKLEFVCTHNSRRSHFGQIWARVAAEYYGIKNVQTYSAGTEATAVHPNTVQALKSLGFEITSDGNTSNPLYSVSFDEKKEPILCFSKTIDSTSNPSKGFAAIMTCSEAEENCPFVPGAELRISTTYEDPKEFDNTPFQEEKYIERSLQIGLENLYIFSLINSQE
jgi:arsenate reductase